MWLLCHVIILGDDPFSEAITLSSLVAIGLAEAEI